MLEAPHPQESVVKTVLPFLLVAVTDASTASAACPPGYSGTWPHCVPQQASHRPPVMAIHAPVSSAQPLHAAPSSSSSKYAVRSPSTPSGSSRIALNPQPIPPGHDVHPAPRHHARDDR